MTANADQLDFSVDFPEIDVASPLQFVVNAAAGSSEKLSKPRCGLADGEVNCCFAAPPS